MAKIRIILLFLSFSFNIFAMENSNPEKVEVEFPNFLAAYIDKILINKQEYELVFINQGSEGSVFKAGEQYVVKIIHNWKEEQEQGKILDKELEISQLCKKYQLECADVITVGIVCDNYDNNKATRYLVKKYIAGETFHDFMKNYQDNPENNIKLAKYFDSLNYMLSKKIFIIDGFCNSGNIIYDQTKESWVLIDALKIECYEDNMQCLARHCDEFLDKDFFSYDKHNNQIGKEKYFESARKFFAEAHKIPN